LLAKRGERILLVETSGLESFEYVRAFYRRSGYNEEARIREFYKTGDDKIIFRKALSA
jgi:ribosomal protein S18 acetylase RimI-like enzyme